MWAYQPHFRGAVEIRTSQVLTELGIPEPGVECLLVGALRPGRQNPNPVCLEPEDGKWPIGPLAGLPDAIEQEKIDDVRRFMASFFSCKDWTLADAENCLYTNAPNEDFIIDLHPENPRIAFGAGFSGHGFKFGPLTGRLLAELAWEGKTSIPEAEMARRLFSLKK